MDGQEYLVSFGLTGEFGRFRTAVPLVLDRGQRVVVCGPRGVEIARVLREAAPGHARYLPNTSVGQLLRLPTPEDEQAEGRARERGRQLFERGRQLAVELHLPLELLDVELLLDGEHAVLHFLGDSDADIRPLVSTLSREFELHVSLIDLGRPRESANDDQEETQGCGRPDCGHGADGGCGTCGSGGGCGTCGQASPSEVKSHFAQLREQMEGHRVALL